GGGAWKMEDELVGGCLGESRQLLEDLSVLTRIRPGQGFEQRGEVWAEARRRGAGMLGPRFYRGELVILRDSPDQPRQGLRSGRGARKVSGLCLKAALEDQLLECGRKILTKEEEVGEAAAAHRPLRAVPVDDCHQPAAHLDGEEEDGPRRAAELLEKTASHRIRRHRAGVASARGADGAEHRGSIEWNRTRSALRLGQVA